jgi:TolB protein
MLGGAALAAPAADAAWPGVNGRLSLTQRVPAGPGISRANRDIFAYARDGDAGRVRLTSSLDNEEQSSWSPDGRRITFKRRDAVWVVDADGSGLRSLTEIVTDGHNSTQPAWSPDGTQLVFRDNTALAPANVADIWIMDAPIAGAPGGTNIRALVTQPGDERYPSFSPDGTRLVFRGDADGVDSSGDEEIYVADADGSNIVQLTDDDVADSAPSWSPDGTRIAFESERDGADREIYVMHADGTGVVRLTDNDVHDEGPVISPDGRLIAFTRADTPTAAGDIWTMNVDGSGAAPLSETPIIEESPDWQALPIDVGGSGIARDACGDVSLEPGQIASIVSIKAPCEKAREIAGLWHAGAIAGSPPSRLGSFDCAHALHSFDQTLVQCDHRGIKKGVAFVYRG